jgi:hypothetical protein
LRRVGLGFAAIAVLQVSARGAPRQDDVFRSIQDNLGQRTDPTMLLVVFGALAAVVIAALALNHWRQREVSPKVLNHPGKLAREIQREVNLRPAEVRQLKALAEGQPVENPLTLLLCPSLLLKAAKENPDRFDRRTVAAMMKRMGS